MKIILLFITFTMNCLFAQDSMFKAVLEQKIDIAKGFKIISIQSSCSDLIYEEVVKSKVECNGCNKVGVHTAKIILDNSPARYVTFKMGKVVKALIAKIDMGPFSSKLKNNDFQIREQISDRPDQLITSVKDIKYYKLNKNINAGNPVLLNDLVAIDLVRYGEPIDITIKKNNIVLKGKARSLGNGKIGQTIRVENSSSKRVYMGTIISNNQVEVRL